MKHGERMTTDNFDYYSDDDFVWTGINKFYKSAPIVNTKGTIFRIEIDLDKNTLIDSDDKQIISSLATDWTWGEDRKLKAFKLLDHKIEENIINLEYITIRKSKKHDEIKFFLYDIGSFLNYYQKEIVAIRVERITDDNSILRK
jgi:hypothetical protein